MENSKHKIKITILNKTGKRLYITANNDIVCCKNKREKKLVVNSQTITFAFHAISFHELVRLYLLTFLYLINSYFFMSKKKDFRCDFLQITNKNGRVNIANGSVIKIDKEDNILVDDVRQIFCLEKKLFPKPLHDCLIVIVSIIYLIIVSFIVFIFSYSAIAILKSYFYVGLILAISGLALLCMIVGLTKGIRKSEFIRWILSEGRANTAAGDGSV